MKDFLAVTTFAFLIFYIFISMVTFTRPFSDSDICYEEPIKISKFFPTMKWGCYLVSKESQLYYDYDSLNEYKKGN